jgi:hypothetical protein
VERVGSLIHPAEPDDSAVSGPGEDDVRDDQ